MNKSFNVSVIDSNKKSIGSKEILVNQAKEGCIYDVGYKGLTFYPTGYAYFFESKNKRLNEFCTESENIIFIDTEFSELLED